MRGVIFLISVVCLLGCDTANNMTDPIDSYFVRYYGTNGDQEATDMIVNADGTALLLGTSTVNNLKSIYLVKVDARGEVIWEKFYSGTDARTAIDIEPVINGEFVILFNSVSLVSGTDINLMVINADGDELRINTFTYTGSTNEVGVSVTPITTTLNGNVPDGYIVAGSTNYDPDPASLASSFENITALFLRFNADGTLYQDWHQASNGKDYCNKVVQVAGVTAADPYLLFGYTSSEGKNKSFNFWTTKLNKDGSGLNLTEGIIPGSPDKTDEILSTVIRTSPNSSIYLLCGLSSFNTSSGDRIYLATSQPSILQPQELDLFDLGKVAQFPNVLTHKVVASPANGGFLVAANSVASNNSDILLIKVGPDGAPVWDAPLVFGGQGDDYVSSVYQLPDKRILVYGTMSIGDDDQKKLALIKTDRDGKFIP